MGGRLRMTMGDTPPYQGDQAGIIGRGQRSIFTTRAREYTEDTLNGFLASAKDDAEYHQYSSSSLPVYPSTAAAAFTRSMNYTPWHDSRARNGHRSTSSSTSTTERAYGGFRSWQRNKMGYKSLSPYHRYSQPSSWSSTPYMYTQNEYKQGFPQYNRSFQPTVCKTRDTKPAITEPEPENKSPEVSPQKIGPLPLWTPELYANPKTGEMHSKPGDATIYTNGLEYPLIQVYVDSKVARNMPANRTTWDPEAPYPTPPQPEPEYQKQEYQKQEYQKQEDQKQEYQGQEYAEQEYAEHDYLDQQYRDQDYHDADYQGPSLLPIIDYDQIYTPQQYLPRWAENNTCWPQVHEIYGTAIGIILKCMSRQLPPTHNSDPFTQDRWLQSHGLPYPATRTLLDRYYYVIPAFRAVGDRVGAVRKRRELKERINKGLEAGKWPGDTDFSELRATCEILRKKGLEFLERWGDLFEMEWVATRQQQRREGGYYC